MFVLQESRVIKMAAVGHLKVTFLLTWSRDYTEQYATFSRKVNVGLSKWLLEDIYKSDIFVDLKQLF